MSAATRILAVADTHLRAGEADLLLDRLRSLPRPHGFDAIFHAGDIVHAEVLTALAALAPVHAVLGNNDRGLALPERLETVIAGARIAMVHDSGPAGGRTGRLRRWFPTADVVLFGHSHIPWHETHVAANGDVQHHVNPGSAMQRRRQPRCTVAVLDLMPDGVAVRLLPVS